MLSTHNFGSKLVRKANFLIELVAPKWRSELLIIAALVGIPAFSLALQEDGQTKRLTGHIQEPRSLQPLRPLSLSLDPSPLTQSLVADHGFLYLSRGNQLYKISESTLLVVKTSELKLGVEARRSKAPEKSKRRRHLIGKPMGVRSGPESLERGRVESYKSPAPVRALTQGRTEKCPSPTALRPALKRLVAGEGVGK